MSIPASISSRIPRTVTVNGHDADARGSYRQQLLTLCELDLTRLHEISDQETPLGKLAGQATLLIQRADYQARGALGCMEI